MERKNNSLLITIVILSLIVIGLSGYIIYDKVINKENEEINNLEKNPTNQNNTDSENLETNLNNNENNKNIENDLEKNEYHTLNGKYEIVKDTYKGEKGEDGYVGETYYFNDNGLFHYDNSTFAYWGYYGNYLIENNKIKLNYLFYHGGGYPSLSSSNEKSIVITIVDSKTIQLNDGTLYRKTENANDVETELLDNFNELINAYQNS